MKTYRTGCMCFLIGLAAWLSAMLEASASVCSTVKIEIVQEVTLERQAFDAMMRIQNGFADLPLTDVAIEVAFQDATGRVVTATSNPANTNALFFIRENGKANIGSLSVGRVEGGKTAEIHWLIVPAAGAGGSNGVGQVYFVGARMTYRLRGEETVMEVTPDRITVKPMPLLTLDYFLPEQVHGDDPYTDSIESSIPFSLGVRVLNAGYGPAYHLKIESAQPRITDNKQGLLVGFEILGSEVNGRAATGDLLADLGTIQTGQVGVARWQMTSALAGKFSSFEAAFTHAGELGGELTSLIRAVRTHTLVRDVLVDSPGRDGIRDFLAKDEQSFMVYESDARETRVSNRSSTAVFSVTGGGAEGEALRVMTVPPTSGPLYADVLFPEGGLYEVRAVTRDDGKTILTNNAWITKSRERGTDPWIYRFHLFDMDRGGEYRVTFARMATPENRSPVMQYIDRKVTQEGQNLGFIIHASDPDGTIPVLTASGLPPGATFTDGANGVGHFDWTVPQGAQGVHPVCFMANDGEYTVWRIARIYVGYAGEALTADGLPVSLSDWKVEIKNLKATSVIGVSTVLWDSVQGVPYRVVISDDPFGAGTVEDIGTELGDGFELEMWDATLGVERSGRYYQVVLADDGPATNNWWAALRCEVAPGYTLMAPPVRTDRRFDGEMGAALAEQLRGNDGGIGSGADEVYVLEAGGAWRTLYLDESRTWREADGSESRYVLPAGQGFWVARRTVTPARLTFTGPVGNDGTQTVSLQPGFNLIGLSEGKVIPLVKTLASGSPVGGATEEMADQVVIQNADGSWRSLMFVTNWGQPYDGQWFDFSTYKTVSTNETLTPGSAFYYLRRGEATNVEF